MKCYNCNNPKIELVSTVPGMDAVEFKCNKCKKSVSYDIKNVKRRTNRKHDLNIWMIKEGSKQLSKTMYNQKLKKQTMIEIIIESQSKVK